MCGIAGVICGDTSKFDLGSLQTMLERIRHRGPDAQGVWSEDNVFLGHRRLSIVDISETGAQPMPSHNNRYVISYNGEIYNFQALRAELDDGGSIAWRGTSDTEVLVELVSRLGFEKALTRISGMFALALWDRHEKCLYLARDRFGEKPLYYALHQGSLFFASELTALEAAPQLPKSIDHNALASFVRRGNFASPHSIYAEVKKLPPASWIKWQAGKLSPIAAYWSLRDVARAGISSPYKDQAEMIDALESAISNSCRQQMVADVPLGAFLSGGIDSSTIVALMQRNSTKRIKTFSIGFDDPNFNEAEHAKAVAQHLGTEHHEQILTSQDAIAVAPQLGGFYDEPFADSSAIPTYLVSRMARSYVTVSLSGDGGDELFGGYSRYAVFPRLWSMINRVPLRGLAADAMLATPTWLLDKLATPILAIESRVGGSGESGGAKLHRIAYCMKAKCFGEYYSLMMSNRNDALLLVPNAREIATTPQIVAGDFETQIESMTYNDAMDYLPNDILTKVDRASMAVSLECRVPLLDPAIAEIACRIPAELRLRDGTGKWVLREVLQRHVPGYLFDRPKMGFGVPLRQWLGGPLKAWAEDLMSTERLKRQGFLDVNKAQELLAGLKSSDGGSHTQLWPLLMFQSWLEYRGQ